MRQVISAVLVLLTVMCSSHSFACSCRISGKVSKYLRAANVVFLGKVVFSDDDGSGTFVQRTFVHFDVQEVFKGLGAGVYDVWVDPGSFASCYAEYRRDERYLVFAYAGTRLPVGAPAMTTAPPGTKRKPLPVGVDAANPPVVYVAPECSGTLPIMQQSQSVVSAWLKDLKAYKKREEQSAANSHTEKHP